MGALRLSFALLVSVVVGCQPVDVEDDSPEPVPAPVPAPVPMPVAAVAREVVPADTFPSDNQEATSPHRVYAGGTGPGAGKLLVFLHGMGGTPSGYTTFLDHASALGFHVIGLSYWDTSQLAGAKHRLDALCDLDGDGIDTAESTCWGEAHREMFDGTATASPFQAPDNLGVQDRLDHLLEFLVAAYPAEGWEQFVVDGHPKWPAIVLAGHSMGAGNAAWIAQRRPVYRLVMISQPADYVLDGDVSVAADWVDDGFDSLAPEDMYGLSHSEDTVALDERTFANWALFGMAGDQCVAGVCPEQACGTQYCGARRLFSNAATGDPHSSTAQDEAVYGATWTYLLTHEL